MRIRQYDIKWYIVLSQINPTKRKCHCPLTKCPGQNGRHFPDDIFKCIFLNQNAWISLKISLKFVPKVRINHTQALVQIMAWRRSGDKPLSEPMMVSLLTHICVTRPQWVNKWEICIYVFWFSPEKQGPLIIKRYYQDISWNLKAVRDVSINLSNGAEIWTPNLAASTLW